VKDAETKSWLATKNLPDAESAFKSYRNMESIFGADRAGRTFMLPKDENDAEGWASVAKRLGVPESADGYKLPLPEGVDDGFARAAAGAFHKAGVPPRQANAIASWWNGWVTEQVTAGERETDARIASEIDQLHREWGSASTANNELAMRGLGEFMQRSGLGDDPLIIKRLQSELGAHRLAKFFYEIGRFGSEAGTAFSERGSSGQTFGMTPRQAQAEIAKIRTDRIEGKITDSDWKHEFEPKVLELAKIASREAA
jgi:hypothetical protein